MQPFSGFHELAKTRMNVLVAIQCVDMYAIAYTVHGYRPQVDR